MAYIVDRLMQASGFSSMLPVERMGSFARKDIAIRTARRLAQNADGSWIQIRCLRTDAIIATYRRGLTSAQKV